jgi:hypothetical protein
MWDPTTISQYLLTQNCIVQSSKLNSTNRTFETSLGEGKGVQIHIPRMHHLEKDKSKNHPDQQTQCCLRFKIRENRMESQGKPSAH